MHSTMAADDEAGERSDASVPYDNEYEGTTQSAPWVAASRNSASDTRGTILEIAATSTRPGEDWSHCGSQSEPPRARVIPMAARSDSSRASRADDGGDEPTSIFVNYRHVINPSVASHQAHSDSVAHQAGRKQDGR